MCQVGGFYRALHSGGVGKSAIGSLGVAVPINPLKALEEHPSLLNVFFVKSDPSLERVQGDPFLIQGGPFLF